MGTGTAVGSLLCLLLTPHRALLWRRAPLNYRSIAQDDNLILASKPYICKSGSQKPHLVHICLVLLETHLSVKLVCRYPARPA